MPARWLESHPYALENTGRAALRRGPILYCAEAAGNPDLAGSDLREVSLAHAEPVAAEFRPDLLAGVVELSVPARLISLDPAWEKALYRLRQPVGQASLQPGRSISLHMIPYYAWANRQPGPMQVWMKMVDSRR
jgi:hypothetical protein